MPRPDPAFARELDRRVADGFPRERRLRLPLVRRVRALPRARMLAVAGAAAAVLLAVVTAIGVLSADGGSDRGAGAGSKAGEAGPAIPGARDAARTEPPPAQPAVSRGSPPP